MIVHVSLHVFAAFMIWIYHPSSISLPLNIVGGLGHNSLVISKASRRHASRTSRSLLNRSCRSLVESSVPDSHWWCHFGKSKTWQNMAKPWQTMAKHGKTMAKHGKTMAKHGKTMAKHAKTMAKHGKSMAKHGKTVAKHAKTMAKPWQNHQHPRTAFWITSQKTWFARLALCWKQVLVCIAQGQPAGFLHTFTWQVIMMRWMEEILHQVIGGLHMFIPLFTRISRGSTIQKKWLQDFFHPNMIKHDPVKSCPNNCGSPMGSE